MTTAGLSLVFWFCCIVSVFGRPSGGDLIALSSAPRSTPPLADPAATDDINDVPSPPSYLRPLPPRALVPPDATEPDTIAQPLVITATFPIIPVLGSTAVLFPLAYLLSRCRKSKGSWRKGKLGLQGLELLPTTSHHLSPIHTPLPRLGVFPESSNVTSVKQDVGLSRRSSFSSLDTLRSLAPSPMKPPPRTHSTPPRRPHHFKFNLFPRPISHRRSKSLGVPIRPASSPPGSASTPATPQAMLIDFSPSTSSDDSNYSKASDSTSSDLGAQKTSSDTIVPIPVPVPTGTSHHWAFDLEEPEDPFAGLPISAFKVKPESLVSDHRSPSEASTILPPPPQSPHDHRHSHSQTIHTSDTGYLLDTPLLESHNNPNSTSTGATLSFSRTPSPGALDDTRIIENELVSIFETPKKKGHVANASVNLIDLSSSPSPRSRSMSEFRSASPSPSPVSRPHQREEQQTSWEYDDDSWVGVWNSEKGSQDVERVHDLIHFDGEDGGENASIKDTTEGGIDSDVLPESENPFRDPVQETVAEPGCSPADSDLEEEDVVEVPSPSEWVPIAVGEAILDGRAEETSDEGSVESSSNQPTLEEMATLSDDSIVSLVETGWSTILDQGMSDLDDKHFEPKEVYVQDEAEINQEGVVEPECGPEVDPQVIGEELGVREQGEDYHDSALTLLEAEIKPIESLNSTEEYRPEIRMVDPLLSVHRADVEETEEEVVEDGTDNDHHESSNDINDYNDSIILDQQQDESVDIEGGGADTVEDEIVELPPPIPIITISTTVNEEKEEHPDPDFLPLPSPPLPLAIAIPAPQPKPFIPDPQSQTPTPPASPPSASRLLPSVPSTPSKDISNRPAWSLRASDAPALGLSASSPSSPNLRSKSNPDLPSRGKATEEKTIALEGGEARSAELVETLTLEASQIQLSTALPGSFPTSPPKPEEDTSVTASRSLLSPSSATTPSSPAVPALAETATSTAVAPSPTSFRARTPRSPIDIALAMQLRPGLGLGADPAWMVRFLMAMFGWFAILISGEADGYYLRN